MTSRERPWVISILVLSGVIILGVTAFFVVALILLVLTPNDDGPVLWDRVVPSVVLFGGLGAFLLSLGIIQLRQVHAGIYTTSNIQSNGKSSNPKSKA